MVIEFKTIYAISAYQVLSPALGNVCSIQHYVIKFVSGLRQVGGFFPGTLVSCTNKTDRHDITEILLKVALNTITLISNILLNLRIFYY